MKIYHLTKKDTQSNLQEENTTTLPNPPFFVFSTNAILLFYKHHCFFPVFKCFFPNFTQEKIQEKIQQNY